MSAANEIEYESDSEEAKLSSKLRRREASDDEAEDGGETRENPPRRIEFDDSDLESEGAAAEYEDGYEEEEVEEDYEPDKEYVLEDGLKAGIDGGGVVEERAGVSNDVIINEETVGVEDGQIEGEKKEIEPYAVPTAGAFYMHDDRFRQNVRGRNRRILGGSKLWESKDDRKWGHDKFEELSMRERSYEEPRRGSRGRNRGRGRSRAAVHGFAQGNRPQELTNNGTQNNDSQNSALKGFRRRGPRRYQPSFKNKAPLTPNKQSGKSNERPSYLGSERISESMFYAEPNVVLPEKQSFASNLNIASPPFYPSSSSTKDNSLPNKRDFQSSGMLRGKNTVDIIGVDKLYIDDSLSGPSSNNSNQQQLRSQSRGIASLTQMTYQPVVSNNQVNRANSSNQSQTVQKSPGQYFVQASGQQFIQHIPSRSQVSSPPKCVGDVNAAPCESNKSKTALVSTGKGSVQGNMGSERGDPNFPAFFPVMQFSGQHHGGVGVPAVGMAFPGYVGRGNSEMTWLPVLTGASGARYGSPYIAVDGSYQVRPSELMSSVKSVSSKENSTTNVGNECKPAQRPELANDELVRRQRNSRRYTEMKFDQ